MNKIFERCGEKFSGRMTIRETLLIRQNGSGVYARSEIPSYPNLSGLEMVNCKPEELTAEEVRDSLARNSWQEARERLHDFC